MDVKKKKNLNVSVKTALTAAGMREILKSWVCDILHPGRFKVTANNKN